MDFVAIFDVVTKGLSVVENLITAGQNALPALTVIKDLVTGAQKGTVTDDDLAKAEAVLDGLIDDFNLD